jgi:serine/threonine protein kinase
LNEFISEQKLQWIPYDKFNNVEFLGKGGFGTIFKATWSDSNKEVALKCLNNLNENLDEFLNEVYNNALFIFF